MLKKLKLFLLLLVLVCSSGQALTVSAVSLAKDTASKGVKDSEMNKIFDELSEFDFDDGIMWMMSICDDKRGLDDAGTIADIEKSHIVSAELQSDHFYTVELMFVVDIDSTATEKYKDVLLQVRFPRALFKDNANGIGSAIHGNKIVTNSYSLGVSSKEDLALYYIKDTAKISSASKHKSTQLTSDGAETLFASSEGFPLDEPLAMTKKVGKREVTAFTVRFLIYAAPLDLDKGVSRGDVELTYWAGRKLMHDKEDSVAPSGYIPNIATMDEDGTVHLPEASEATEETNSDDSVNSGNSESSTTVTTIVILVIFVLVVLVLLIIKIRQARAKGITGFWNISIWLLNDIASVEELDDEEDFEVKDEGKSSGDESGDSEDDNSKENDGNEDNE